MTTSHPDRSHCPLYFTGGILISIFILFRWFDIAKSQVRHRNLCTNLCGAGQRVETLCKRQYFKFISAAALIVQFLCTGEQFPSMQYVLDEAPCIPKMLPVQEREKPLCSTKHC